MVPKDIGKDYRYDGLRPQRIITTSPNVRRRQGPVTRQPSILEEVRLACIKGDLIAVQNLIEGGRISVNCLLDDGWSPLMIAASAARPAVLEYLLLQDADPNLIRKDNFSALMAAAGSSQTRTGDTLLCVTLLLQTGSFVNAKDNNGVTPLGYAVKEKKLEVAKCLIEAGANLDSLDRNGRNCLFYAAERGFGQVARLLLEKGASVDVVDRNGWMLAEAAVEKGHYKLGELLFRVRESRWRPGKSPALMTAFNDVPEPKFLLEPDTDTAEGIVNILTNIQTQVRCLSNLINSVRLRMVQDVSTKEYEVETGKMDELVVFARSMGKSCAILTNQVSSLNILLDGDTRMTTMMPHLEVNSAQIVATVGNNSRKGTPPPTRVPRRVSKSPRNTPPPLPSPPPPVAPSKEVVASPETAPAKLGYIYSDYYSYYKKQQQNRGGWSILMAGAVSMVLLCCVAPQLRTRLPTRLWRI